MNVEAECGTALGLGWNSEPLPVVVKCNAEGVMSFLDKLLGRAPEKKPRVRVCIECGMPVEKHADWCAIYRTQQELDEKRRGSGA